jgi:hypothetical protein
VAIEDVQVGKDYDGGARAARACAVSAIRGRAYDKRSGLAARVVNRITDELALSLVAVAR